MRFNVFLNDGHVISIARDESDLIDTTSSRVTEGNVADEVSSDEFVDVTLRVSLRFANQFCNWLPSSLLGLEEDCLHRGGWVYRCVVVCLQWAGNSGDLAVKCPKVGTDLK